MQLESAVSIIYMIFCYKIMYRTVSEKRIVWCSSMTVTFKPFLNALNIFVFIQYKILDNYDNVTVNQSRHTNEMIIIYILSVCLLPS